MTVSKARRNSGRKGERGQSTVEFALTLMLIMGFTMFFLRLALLFAFANYAQYATFMAARAYQSARSSQEQQAEQARTVIQYTLKKPNAAGQDAFPMIARGEGGDGDLTGMQLNSNQFAEGEPDSSWMQGVRYTFRSRLFVLPFAGVSEKNRSVNSLELTSESWLGREPSYIECQDELGKVQGLFDNGC